ncbi:MAG: hypothetical protein IPL99_12250 [Candidatus Competibacteraceae bacterium]|nr:hypothetical protein [Candidatus Competibacteraceae bacterium]
MGRFLSEPVDENIVSALEFLKRLTPPERIAIRTSANPIVNDFRYMLENAPSIRLDNTDTVNGTNDLEAIGLIAVGRAAEILSPVE